jgi:prepilin-type N-terminal cleavage/methylation domain-containing protein
MRRGFTLIEVLITISIVAITAMIGWGSMDKNLPRFRLMSAAKGLKADLVNIQNMAVQTNRETRLRLVDNAGACEDVNTWGGRYVLEIGDRSRGSTGWEVIPMDAEEDGSDDDQSEGWMDLGEDGNRKARFVCLQEWEPLDGPGTGSEDSLVFSPRGWLQNPVGDFQSSGYVELDLVNLIAAADGINDRVTIKVSRAGMVRLQTSLGRQGPDGTAGTGMSSER